MAKSIGAHNWAPARVGSMTRTILKAFLEPFVIVLAAVYFVIDALALSILKPLLRKIANLKVFSRLK
jgi:hypothetical protein